MNEAWKQQGFPVHDDEMERDRGQLASFKQTADLPNDRALLDDLGLGVWYDRLYRFSSDYVHFSLGVAINEIHDVDEAHFDAKQPELADEGLYLAILVYGDFLRLSEKTVRHGLVPHVRRIVRASAAFKAIPAD